MDIFDFLHNFWLAKNCLPAYESVEVNSFFKRRYMNIETFNQALRPMRAGILLALLSLILGFALGGAFGGFSAPIRGHFKEEAQKVVEAKYKGDMKNANSALDKAWSYLKRSHLHASGLGTTSLVLILLLATCRLSSTTLFLTSLALGLGALGYSVYWLLAGWTVPSIGNADEAKEALRYLAIPSAGLCIVGLLLTTFFCIRNLFGRTGE